MNIINNNGTQVDTDQNDQGSGTQGAPSTAPPVAPSAQIATTDGEQKGANKRAHGTMVASGHTSHSFPAQRMSQADNINQSSSTATNMANLPALSSAAPAARIRREIQDVAAPAKQSSLSIPVAPAANPTTQAMVLLDRTTAEIALHTSVLSSPAPRAHAAAPEYHYSTTSRKQSRYDFGRNDGPSRDDFHGSSNVYGNPRNFYGNRNARFAMSKGKGKGRSFNTKSTWGAMPKDWDADQVVIPEFGTTPGISFYTVNNLTTEGASTYTVKNPAALVRSPAPGHPIQYLDSRQIRMRTNPSDLNQDGTPIDNIVFHYNTALRAIHEVRQSVAHFQFMEESGRVVDLRGIPIPNGYAIDPHYLLGENLKSHLGDFWRVLRHRPATNALKSFNPDIKYVPNNTYSFYQVKKTSVQSARVQVKPSRYWDERPAKDIPDDILYSLCDFWPSMPIDVDIINENTLLGLPLYRMNEQRKINHARPGARVHMVNDSA